MASVLPKVKNYFFLSVICLLINLSVFATSVIASESTGNDINDFLDYNENDDYSFEGDLPEDTNASIEGFVLSAGSSFVPFFSLLPLSTMSLPDVFLVFSGIIITIIGAFQVFFLAVIILNLAPKVLGSGWDV